MTIYFDNSATTQVSKEVADTIYECMTTNFGNPSSVHQLGQKAKYILDDSREKVAKVINANPSEIFFTSGGTEADNWAIRGVIEANKRFKSGKKVHIISSEYEHSAVIETLKYISETMKGHELVDVTILPVTKDGYVSINSIKDAIREETILVSIMHVNNEIGNINDIASIGKLCRSKGILFHTDAVQSFTKVPIDVRKQDIDLLSCAGHKIYGPKGIGALFVRKGVEISPIMFGGQQESKMRMGTENLPGIAGLGKASELAVELFSENMPKIAEIKNYIYKTITSELDGVHANGDVENGFSGVLSLTFDGIEGEALALSLDMEGVCVSTGSACSSGSVKPSRVLLSLGMSEEEAQSSIRMSFGVTNTLDEAKFVADKIVEIVKRLRSMGNF